MTTPTCGSCRFYSGDFEECRARPPVWVKDGEGGTFPSVMPNTDWCGEYQPAEGAPTTGEGFAPTAGASYDLAERFQDLADLMRARVTKPAAHEGPATE